MNQSSELTAQMATTWEEVWKVLNHHKKKATPQHTLNRLFHEHCPNAPDLTPDTTAVHKERWSTDQLNKTVRKDTVTTGPSMLDVPVVVVRWNGKDYLVDGRRRVNTWVKNDSKELHDILLIQPK